MSCLKQSMLVAALRLLGEFIPSIKPAYDKFCIPNFDLRQSNFSFFITREFGHTIIASRTENLIKLIRRAVITVKFKNYQIQ